MVKMSLEHYSIQSYIKWAVKTLAKLYPTRLVFESNGELPFRLKIIICVERNGNNKQQTIHVKQMYKIC